MATEDGTSAYQAKYFAHALTREGGENLDRLRQSLLNAAVDLNPHQVEAALFALRSPLAKGVLLADEVGLGKTIEAGLVMCQLWAERKRRILVVCPASLRKQWQCELEDKFSLPAVIVDAKSARLLQKEGFANPYEKPAVLISSYPFAAKSAANLRLVAWDLVVLDEAHKLRNSYRESNRVGQALRLALEDRRKILLTATPLQNSLTELYGIATLLDKTAFGDLPSFRSRYVNAGGDLDGLRERLKEFTWRTLRRDVEAFVRYTKRFPLTESFACTDREQALYEDVSAYLQDETTYAFPPSQRAMLTLLVRKVLASSSVALAGTLETILARLRRLRSEARTPTASWLDDLLGEDPDLVEELSEDHEEEADEESVPHDLRAAEDAPAETDAIDPRRLEAEIARVADLAARARAIGADRKTQRLLTALEKGWARLRELGAAEKAVVFTESRRTMAFLKDYLEAHGYAGQVVCFSGGGRKDETAERIYAAYRAAHPEDASSRPVMMRHALIDAFRREARILLATEAGAEGINLQFCSMVVNYDLPWNPQRVEQRIGRCHRYGQKHDVVVVNFLNTRNAADVRVHEILERKLRLFEGLFGASNGILGVLDKDGKSFERQIGDILQRCRTAAEIERAFDDLQASLQKEIDARLARTQRDVLENLDEDVRKVLKVDYGAAKEFLSDGEARFLAVTRQTLGGRVRFEADDPRTFTLLDAPADGIATGRYSLNRANLPAGCLAYRPNSALGEWALAAAKAAATPPAEVAFDLSSYPGKISTLAALKGMGGFLLLDKMTVNAFEADGFLLLTGFTDAGAMVPPEDLEKLFKLPQTMGTAVALPSAVTEKLAVNARLLADATLRKSLEANNALFKERLGQLDRWVEDQVSVAEHALAAVKAELRAARHEQDVAANQEELAAAAARVEALERKKRRARRQIDEAEEKADADRQKIIVALKAKMVQKVTRETLFTIRWKVI